MHRGEESLKLYDLMQNSDHKKVQDSEGWRELARLVIQICTAVKKTYALGLLVHCKDALCACAEHHGCFTESAS